MRERAALVAGAALVLAGLLPTRARAQGVVCDTLPNPWEFLRHCARDLVPGDSGAPARLLKEAYANLHSPATLNAVLGEGTALVGRVNRLGSLHLRFVNVAQNGRPAQLGVGYDWRRDLYRTPHRQGSSHRGVVADLTSRGLLTHDDSLNPDDYLESAIAVRMFFGRGGAVTPATLRAQVEAMRAAMAQPAPAVGVGDGELPVPIQLMGAVWDSLTTQFYLTAGSEARLESTQSFDHRQRAVGLSLGLEIKAWKPTSRAAKANVFDWPAAAIRYLTGTDARFRPSGVAIPTLVMGLHRVHLDQHPTRAAVTPLDPHNRVEIRISYRSKLAQVRGGPVWLEAEYRRTSEVDPPGAVKIARLHESERFHAAVHGSNGMFVAYTTGSHPTDFDDAGHWSIGFRARM